MKHLQLPSKIQEFTRGKTYPIGDEVLRGKVIRKISINNSAGEQMWQKLEYWSKSEGIFIPFPKATPLTVQKRLKQVRRKEQLLMQQ